MPTDGETEQTALGSSPPFARPMVAPTFCSDVLTFVREFMENPRTVGAVCSSSRRLGECISRYLDLTSNGFILELGGGTGAITDVLLRRVVPPDRLVVLEQSERFVRHLRNRFPGVHVVGGDAGRAEELLHRLAPFDAIVSGLPLHSLCPKAVSHITHACAGLLSPNGKLLQFTYALTATSPWLGANLRKVASQTVFLNVPPARVDVFHHDTCELRDRVHVL
jgi:phosphatidylethanolamine/phosphatidyl-N-methylethanolamine N-methyltransferase